MSLTIGTGPFGREAAGRFNFDPPQQVLYLERSPRWFRASFGGETVIDSRRARLLHESSRLPLLYPRR